MWTELLGLTVKMMQEKIDITRILEKCASNLDTQEVIIELYHLSEYLKQQNKNG
jgi:hypothetical protein